LYLANGFQRTLPSKLMYAETTVSIASLCQLWGML